MKDPARRYKVLLRIYPQEYRSVRGDEILATLLDAADERGLTSGEVLYVLAHAVRVWTRRIALGPRGRPLPQPVRFVTWVLIALCTWNWLGAVVDLVGHRPQNDIPPGPVVAGFVFFGLNALIQSRRRFLYVVAIAVIASFVVSGLVQTRWSVGAIVEIPYTILVLLLLIGWHRSMAFMARDRGSFERSRGKVIFDGDTRLLGPDHHEPALRDEPNQN